MSNKEIKEVSRILSEFEVLDPNSTIDLDEITQEYRNEIFEVVTSHYSSDIEESIRLTDEQVVNILRNLVAKYEVFSSLCTGIKQTHENLHNS